MRWARCEVDISSSETTDDIYEEVRDALQRELDEADNRSVAVRLVLQGASAAHSELLETRDHCIQEYRSLSSAEQGS